MHQLFKKCFIVLLGDFFFQIAFTINIAGGKQSIILLGKIHLTTVPHVISLGVAEGLNSGAVGRKCPVGAGTLGFGSEIVVVQRELIPPLVVVVMDRLELAEECPRLLHALISRMQQVHKPCHGINLAGVPGRYIEQEAILSAHIAERRELVGQLVSMQ